MNIKKITLALGVVCLFSCAQVFADPLFKKWIDPQGNALIIGPGICYNNMDYCRQVLGPMGVAFGDYSVNYVNGYDRYASDTCNKSNHTVSCPGGARFVLGETRDPRDDQLKPSIVVFGLSGGVFY